MQALKYLRCEQITIFRRPASSFRRFRFRKESPSNKERALPSNLRTSSLLDELFPEEAQHDGVRPKARESTVPRLDLFELDELFEDCQDDLDGGSLPPQRVTKAAAADAFRQDQLAVLALQIGSKSLVEGDFRRITPKGKHIKDWTGPGNILKVIPVRDPVTLEPSGQYYILFSNPAYARTYQNHVLSLQRMAKTHTPTSIESPLAVQQGVIIHGDNIHDILRDYALCPPSQRMRLKLMYPYYSTGTRPLLHNRGYDQLVHGDGKTNGAVLFWVDGQQITSQVIRNTIAADGRERGLAWSVSIEKLDTSVAIIDQAQDPGSVADEGDSNLKTHRHIPARWILSFADEAEARRFIRAWHRMPFPLTRGDGPRLVHAEMLW